MTQLSLTNEKINSYGGLTLAGRLISKFCKLGEFFKIPKGSRSGRIPDADILSSMIGLLVQGRTHYEDIELFRQDASQGFSEALDLENIPSEATLRTRLSSLATKPSMQKLEGINLALLKAHPPSPLEINGRKYIANDIDVTPIMNMFVVLIPFLVSMAVFAHFTVHNFSLPSNAADTQDIQTGEVTLKTTLVLEPTYLLVTLGGEEKDSLRYSDDWRNTLPAILATVKSQATDTNSAIISVSDDIPFEWVVKAMDYCKAAGFEDIGLSEAPISVLSDTTVQGDSTYAQ